MIVEYLRYTIPADQRDAFIRDYRAATEPLMRSPHARAFELCQCSDDHGQFIIRIEWSSASDHLQGFRSSPEFRAFFGHIRPYLGAIDEMRHYDQRITA